MFNFIKNIETENIPFARAILNFITAVITYSLLLSLVFIINFNWHFIYLAVMAAVMSVLVVIFESDVLKKVQYKYNRTLLYISLVCFYIYWRFILHILLNINVGKNVTIVMILACAFSLARLLYSVFTLPKIMKTAAKLKEIKEKFVGDPISQADLIKPLQKEINLLGRRTAIIIFLSFLPLILFLWSAYYMVIAMNLSFNLKLYIVFVIIFQSILSGFSNNLRKKSIKELINE